MSVCHIIFGGVVIAVSIKFFSELVRTGNATSAVWSTLQSVGEVTSKLAMLVTSAGDSIASFAKTKIDAEEPGDNHEQYN
jgi:hypothetical protein